MRIIALLTVMAGLAACPPLLLAGALQVNLDYNGTGTFVELVHYTLGSEGVDPGLDRPDSPSPANVLNIYSRTALSQPFDRLEADTRGRDSMTAFATEIVGVNLADPPVAAQLSCLVALAAGEDNFRYLNLVGRLYRVELAGDTLLETYDLKALAAHQTAIPLQVANGLSYKFNVEFYALADLNIDGRVDVADAAILADRWLQQVSPADVYDPAGRADLAGPADGPDGLVNLYDLAEMSRQWLWRKPQP